MMARAPDQSLPKQAGCWSDLKGAYRLLSNGRVEPTEIGSAHRGQVWRESMKHPVVLCVQDDTDMQAVKVVGRRHIQHTTLAVLPGGGVLGVLDQRWFARPTPGSDETRAQRMARWRESCVWSDAAEALGKAEGGPGGCRLIHVSDRASDDLNFMGTCGRQGHGFVIRARHDRRVDDAQDKLWSRMDHAPALGTLTVQVGEQRAGGRITRRGREARVTVRAASVTLDPPWNHPAPGTAAASRTVQAIYLRETDPPKDTDPIDWMLLTSEPAEHFDDARRLIGYYQQRWVIEEWHRAIKEGCRLKQSQLDDADGLQRLAAILSIIAVRMLQLRDLADSQISGDTAEDPQALQRTTDRTWITLVAALADTPPEQLTPKQFWRTLALRGGWPGRKRDPRPGWKVLWRGWHDLTQMVRGVELIQKHPYPKGCG